MMSKRTNKRAAKTAVEPRAFVYTVEIDGEWWTVTTSGPFRDEDQARAFSDWLQSDDGGEPAERRDVAVH